MSEIKELKFTKIRGVKTPNRANPTDAGIDLFVPFDLHRLDMNKTIQMTQCDIRVDVSQQNGCVTNIVIGPGEQALIPTGICVNVPKGYVLKIEDKSSIAVRKGLHCSAGIIDSGYQGEILVSVFNTTNKDNKNPKMSVLCPGDKFCQAVLYKIDTPELVEVNTTVELFKDTDSTRGEGGFGSTGVQ